MKQKLLSKLMLLLFALIAGSTSVWADDVTKEVTLSDGTFSTDHITWNLDDVITIQQLKGSSGTDVNSSYVSAPRVYKGHILSFIAASGYAIKSISLTVSSTYYGNSMTAGTTLSGTTVTDNTTDVARSWTSTSGGTHVVSSNVSDGLSAIYIQNVASTTVQLRFTTLSITYASTSAPGQVVMPNITIPDGPFLDTKDVTITTVTEGASIYYTTNGDTPTSGSTAYSAPFEISATTTVKAIAIKDGLTDSEVAMQTFTKVTPMNVASARTYIDVGENLTGQCVSGKISQIDTYSSNQITYWISDDGSTTDQMEVYKGKGLDNANFAAVTDLVVGDDVVVYGTLQKYNETYEFAAGNYIVQHTYPITTVQVNDGDMGSAVLTNRTTITATPESGYRIKAGTAGYTVESGTVAVTNNGDNTFTISASTDCTVTINFELIPTYTVTCVAAPAVGGTVVAVDASLAEGETTSITATPNSGYEFTGWSVSGTGASLSSDRDNPTMLTMGTDGATVTATFAAATTHEISWSVNGVIVETENVVEGNAITFDAPASGIPSGYVFKGWVVEANQIGMPTDTDPSANYVNSANSTVDITYYAVLARNEEVISTDELNLSFTGVSGTSYSAWSGKSGSSSDAVYAGQSAGGNSSVQLRATSPSGIITTTSGGYVRKVSVTWNSGTSSGRTLDVYGKNTAYSTAGDLYGDNKGTKIGSIVYGTSTELTIDDDYEFIGLRSTSGAMYLDEIDIEWAAPHSVGYCTQTTYTRDVIADKWGTLCLPYNANVEGATLYTFEGVDNTSTPTTAYFEEAASVEAGKPYFFKATGTTLTATYTTGAAKAATSVKGAVGTLTDIDVAEGKYLLSNGELVKCGTGCTLNANRAYIDMSEASVYGGGGAVKMQFDVTDDVATLRDGETMDEVFDLSGRRVVKPTKGLYIVNGKKIMVK